MQENPQMDNGSGASIRPPKQPLNRNQKIALTVLSVFSVFLVIMWSVNMHNNITGPFSIADNTALGTSTPVEDVSNVNNPGGLSDAQIADLKSKDTDGDGLSDYDELYVYHTSPYLADSDSDGVADGQEIKNATDPNCPTGQVCNTPSTATSTDQQTNHPQDVSSLLNALSNNAPSTTSGSSSVSQLILNGQSDAASLRKALLNAGMDPKILNQLSDTDLMQSYQATLKNGAGNK